MMNRLPHRFCSIGLVATFLASSFSQASGNPVPPEHQAARTALAAPPDVLRAFGSEGGNGGDGLSIQIKSDLERLFDTLINSNRTKIDGVRIEALKRTARDAVIETTPKELFITNDQGQITRKDALNFPEDHEILFSLARADSLEPQTRLKLLVHEVLGLSGIADKAYATSGTIVAEYLKSAAPEDLSVPRGLTRVALTEGRFSSKEDAMRSCRALANVYLESYNNVICEPVSSFEKITLSWNEAYRLKKFAGFEVHEEKWDSSWFEHDQNLTMAKAAGPSGYLVYGSYRNRVSAGEEHSYKLDTHAVYEDELKIAERHQDYTRPTYGYCIYVSEPLQPNDDEPRVLVDSRQGAHLLVSKDRSAVAAAGAEVVALVRTSGYEAVYTVEENPEGYYFVIKGKPRFKN